jgi:hypothetical protein
MAFYLNGGKAGEREGSYLKYYWTQSGEYTVFASIRAEVSPAPKGAKDAGNGFGMVTLTSNPVKLTVVDPKAE